MIFAIAQAFISFFAPALCKSAANLPLRFSKESPKPNAAAQRARWKIFDVQFDVADIIAVLQRFINNSFWRFICRKFRDFERIFNFNRLLADQSQQFRKCYSQNPAQASDFDEILLWNGIRAF